MDFPDEIRDQDATGKSPHEPEQASRMIPAPEEDEAKLEELMEMNASPVPGLTLRAVLRGHEGSINRIKWSPDGRYLATPSHDRTVRIWDAKQMSCIAVLRAHSTAEMNETSANFASVSWSSNGMYLAGNFIASYGTNNIPSHTTVHIWETKNWELVGSVPHSEVVYQVSWSPTEDLLALACQTAKVIIVGIEDGVPLSGLSTELEGNIYCLDWSQDGQRLAAGSLRSKVWIVEQQEVAHTIAAANEEAIYCIHWQPGDEVIAFAGDKKSVHIWDLKGEGLRFMLEDHTDRVFGLRFSPEGNLLATASHQELLIWRTDTWQRIVNIGNLAGDESEGRSGWSSPEFHPHGTQLAYASSKSHFIRIWDIDYDALLGNAPAVDTTHYTAAKVVLVGDTGVGKTGLGWRVAKGEFKEHSSTHGQQFWVVDELGKTREDGTKCEAVLWDLAGQHVYRQVHSIFLDNVDAALVLFDPSNRPDPLKGAQFWLEQLRGKGQLPPAILVGGRVDRGAPAVSREELERFCKEYGVAGGYIGTSARSGEGLPELMEALKAQIPWERMATTVTTVTFKRIKEFVLALKADTERKGVLVRPEELRARLEDSDPEWRFSDAEMITAVGHLQTHGYVSILQGSGGATHILLAPDLLVSLAASMVLQADRHARDLGAVSEGDLLAGKYQLDELRGLDQEEQQVLLDAAVLRFVGASICFRETLEDDTLLIFPALIKQRRPLADDTPTTDDNSYIVRGRVENIYAMLVVLLGYTPSFTRINQWQSQAQYELGQGEVCGFRMLEEREGEIELVLYFGERMPARGRELFLSLFERFLYQREVEVDRVAPAICPNGHRLKRAAVVARAREGKGFAHCDECGARVELPGLGRASIGLGDDPWLLREAASAQLQSLYEAHLVRVKSYRRGWAAPRCYLSHLPGQAGAERLTRDLLNAGVALLDDPAEVQPDDVIVILATPGYKAAWDSGAPELADDLALIKGRLRAGDKRRVLSITLEREGGPPPPHDLAACKAGDCSDPAHYPVGLLNLVLDLYAIPHDHAAFLPLRRSLHEQWERMPRLAPPAPPRAPAVAPAAAEQPPAAGERYLDFELFITGDGQATARSAEGEASARLALHPPEEIELAIELIGQGAVSGSLIRKAGKALYGWLFPEAIHTHLHQTEAIARDKGAKLRLRLRVEAPSVARLPLELAYRESGGYYLAVNPATVLSRYLGMPLPPGRARRRAGPLHMLAIIAEPQGLPPVDGAGWEAMLRRALARPIADGLLTLSVVREGTRGAIGAALRERKPDIVQVVAHGFYEDGRGWIALVDEATGEKWAVDEERFAGLFLGHADSLGLVCLATCESARSDDPQGFVGLAPRLAQSCGVPAVVAMQYPISTEAAQVFLEELYSAVAARKPVDWAVQAARGAVAARYGYDNRAFATPVLLLRASDGEIF